MTGNLALPTLIAISSAALSKPPISSLAVLGEISIGGTLIKVEDLASTLQVCLDSGAKKVLLPITSTADLGTVPANFASSVCVFRLNRCGHIASPVYGYGSSV